LAHLAQGVLGRHGSADAAPRAIRRLDARGAWVGASDALVPRDENRRGASVRPRIATGKKPRRPEGRWVAAVPRGHTHGEVRVAVIVGVEEDACVVRASARDEHAVPVPLDVELVRSGIAESGAELRQILLTGLVVGALRVGLTFRGYRQHGRRHTGSEDREREPDRHAAPPQQGAEIQGEITLRRTVVCLHQSPPSRSRPVLMPQPNEPCHVESAALLAACARDRTPVGLRLTTVQSRSPLGSVPRARATPSNPSRVGRSRGSVTPWRR